MSYIQFTNNQLYIESVSAKLLVAEYGTPLYVYSKSHILDAFNQYQSACGEQDLICYAVKANSNLAILNLLAKQGAGFDIVSIGELERVIAAGGDAKKVVFSGVAKKALEIKKALEYGIHCFNVESAAELERINQVALSLGTKAPISLRVNPDVDAQTHPYISTGLKDNKFGIPANEAIALFQYADTLEGILIKGIDCHIGSQIIDPAPLYAALDKLLTLVNELKQHHIILDHIDLGGGLGVNYENEIEPDVAQFVHQVKNKIAALNLNLILEPGRSIVANAGVLLTEVEYLKNNGNKHFAIVDAAMNDLLRPALYQAWMNIQPIQYSDAPSKLVDIVGPVCESSDFLGKDRQFPIEAGEFLAVFSAGAYGFGMASNYNSRPRAAEILVFETNHQVVRQREVMKSLFANESLDQL